jgi:hypothetical protein
VVSASRLRPSETWVLSTFNHQVLERKPGLRLRLVGYPPDDRPKREQARAPPRPPATAPPERPWTLAAGPPITVGGAPPLTCLLPRPRAPLPHRAPLSPRRRAAAPRRRRAAKARSRPPPISPDLRRSPPTSQKDGPCDLKASPVRCGWAWGTPYAGDEEAAGIDALGFLSDAEMLAEMRSWRPSCGRPA